MQNVIRSNHNFLSFSKVFIFIIILSLLMNCLSVSTYKAAEMDDISYKITSISGITYIKYGGGNVKTQAYEGMTLGLGDSIITDDYSNVELLSPEGDLVTIYANSIYTITELSEGELHLTSWVGKSYIEANSRKDSDKVLILNTPSSQFIIRGTHLFTNVHPFTGDSYMNIFSGMVQSNSMKNLRNEETNNNGENNSIDLFAAQYINVIAGQQNIITLDPSSFIQEADPDVILLLLLNKEMIDTENEELNSEFIEHLIQSGIISGDEERKVIDEAVQNYINFIIQNALEQNLINEEELPEELINSIQLASNFEGSFLTDILNRQQVQLDQLRQQQEARERQLEEQKRRQEEQQRKNQELLDQLQKQREEQQKRNEAAEEERRRQAEEAYKQRLEEEERRRFEEAQKQRDEERKRMEEQQRQKQQLEEKRKQEQEEKQPSQENQEQQKQEEQTRQNDQQKNDNQEQEKKENQNQDPIHVTPSPPKEEPTKDDTKEEEKKEEEKQPKPPVVTIDHINDLYRQVVLGGSFTLPSTVQASMSDGTSRQLPIKWVSTHIDTSKPGTYQLTGTVAGYSKLVRLHYYVQAGDEAFLLLPTSSQRDGNTWIISSSREKLHFYLPEVFTTYAGIQVHFLYDPNITVQQVLNPYSESWITAHQEHRGVTSAGEEKVELVYTILFDKNKGLPSEQFKEELLFTLEVAGIYHDQTTGRIELKKVSGHRANGEVKEIKIKKPDPWHKKDYRVE